MTKPTRLINTIVVLICSFLILSCDPETESLSGLDANSVELETELSAIRDIMFDDPQTAITRSDEVIKRAESNGLSYFSGKAKWYKAYIHDDIDQDITKAYFYYNEALKDLEGTDSAPLKMKVYTNLGNLYIFYEQYDEAIKNYEAALSLEDELTTKQQSDLYYNYGVALKLKGDEASFFAAEEALTKANSLAREIEDNDNIATINNFIGLMYKEVGDYDMARIAYKNTIRTFRSDPEMAENVGKAYHGIGVTYMDEGDHVEAISAFEKALVYKEESGTRFVTKYDLGSVLLQAGYKEEGVNTLRDALKERHDKSNFEQVQIYSKLTDALAENGQFQEALSYSQIYNSTMNNIVTDQQRNTANNKVLFASIVKDYAEFNKQQPISSNPWLWASLVALLVGGVLMLSRKFQKSKLRYSLDQINRIKAEFQDIRVD